MDTRKHRPSMTRIYLNVEISGQHINVLQFVEFSISYWY